MDEIMKLDDSGEISVGDTNILELTGDLLADARADLTKATTLSVPIAQLATLGARVASLVPALNTVTQTISFDTSVARIKIVQVKMREFPISNR